MRAAALGRMLAAVAERAAARALRYAGDLSPHLYMFSALLRFGIRGGHRSKQHLCIGVKRVGIKLLAFRYFHYAAKIHHQHPIADMTNNSQIVRDKEIRNAQLRLEPFQQVDDLCLHRNIKCGDRLIADNK